MSQWAEVLREQKRSGLSIKRFCESQGINRQSYFYWQKKLRAAACEEMSRQEAQRSAIPEGWTLCKAETAISTLSTEGKSVAPDQLTVEVKGVQITVGSEYPTEKLAQLLRELMVGC